MSQYIDVEIAEGGWGWGRRYGVCDSVSEAKRVWVKCQRASSIVDGNLGLRFAKGPVTGDLEKEKSSCV